MLIHWTIDTRDYESESLVKLSRARSIIYPAFKHFPRVAGRFVAMSFVSYSQDCQFPIENLPYGVFSKNDSPRVGVAIGDQVLDLAALAETNLVLEQKVFTKEEAMTIFSSNTLNEFISYDRSKWQAWRKFLQMILSKDSTLAKDTELQKKLIVSQSAITMHLPIAIGDYTDFYSSYQHAYNCGVIIRGKEKAMNPNWSWLPVAYHGRASSVVVSGTNIHRPRGQRRGNTDAEPVFGPSTRLDYELEMAFVVGGKGNKMGESISTDEASEHIFGCVIVNDWSARDIQTWEYVPLGPFLSKSFATTISPWIVTMEALECFKVEATVQKPEVLPYLKQSKRHVYDVELGVSIRGQGSASFTPLATSNLKYVYWTFGQQLAHHTVNGCPMRPGDLCATGTISGEAASNYGSLLEKTQGGKEDYSLEGVQGRRKFLEDGDEVKMTAIGTTSSGVKIGFGECVGKVLPSL